MGCVNKSIAENYVNKYKNIFNTIYYNFTGEISRPTSAIGVTANIDNFYSVLRIDTKNATGTVGNTFLVREDGANSEVIGIEYESCTKLDGRELPPLIKCRDPLVHLTGELYRYPLSDKPDYDCAIIEQPENLVSNISTAEDNWAIMFHELIKYKFKCSGFKVEFVRGHLNGQKDLYNFQIDSSQTSKDVHMIFQYNETNSSETRAKVFTELVNYIDGSMKASGFTEVPSNIANSFQINFYTNGKTRCSLEKSYNENILFTQRDRLTLSFI